jgi:enoyl-[acyl-carrier protein] reductase I
MYTVDLTGKNALIFGVANHRSIAWAIAQALYSAGARVALTYQTDRLKEGVEELAKEIGDAPLFLCDVSNDGEVEELYKKVGETMGTLSTVVHSIAFAQRDDLGGDFSKTEREGFRVALDVSAFSLIPVVRYAAPLMTEGGTVIAMTFLAAEKVFPGYNVMGVAKAALENSVKQLAAEFGPSNIRVNAISAGPLDTLSSRVITGYRDMKRIHQERAPMARNITHEDVGGTALYLASELSSGVTGAIIPVDVGYSIMGL